MKRIANTDIDITSKHRKVEKINAVKKPFVRNNDYDLSIYTNLECNYVKIEKYVYNVKKITDIMAKEYDVDPENAIGLTFNQYQNVSKYIINSNLFMTNFTETVTNIKCLSISLKTFDTIHLFIKLHDMVKMVTELLNDHIIYIGQQFNVYISGMYIIATIHDMDNIGYGKITDNTIIDFEINNANINIYNQCIHLGSLSVEVFINNCQDIYGYNEENSEPYRPIKRFPLIIGQDILNKYIKTAFKKKFFCNNTKIVSIHDNYEFVFNIKLLNHEEDAKYKNIYELVDDEDMIRIISNVPNVIITKNIMIAKKIYFSLDKSSLYTYMASDFILCQEKLVEYVKNNIKGVIMQQTFNYSHNFKELILRATCAEPYNHLETLYQIDPNTKFIFNNEKNGKFIVVNNSTPYELKSIIFKIDDNSNNNSRGLLSLLFGDNNEDDIEVLSFKKLVKIIRNYFPKNTTLGHRALIPYKTSKFTFMVKEMEFLDKNIGKNSKKRYENYGLITEKTEIKFDLPKENKLLIIDNDEGENILKNPIEELEKEVGGITDQIKMVIRNICLSRGKLKKEFQARGLKATKGIILYGLPGTGKCLHPDTPIIMYDGSIKLAKDIKIGNQLMGDDSKPRNVLSTCTGQEEMYRIKQGNGDDYIVNKSHILSLICIGKPTIIHAKDRYYVNWWKNGEQLSRSFTINTFGKNGALMKAKSFIKNIANKKEIIDISVAEYLNKPVGFKNNYKGFKVGVQFKSIKVPIDPYLLGFWLGDETTITNIGEVTEEFTTITKNMNHTVTHYKINYHIYLDKKTKTKFLNFLQDYKLIENKYIPDIYKCNNRKIRLKLMAGIIDICGHYSARNNCYYITQKDNQLLKDIIYLSRSLGFRTYICKQNKSCDMNSLATNLCTMIRIRGMGIEEIPVKNKHTMIKSKQTKNAVVYDIELESLGMGTYCGFSIDGNRRFLLGDFTVTHNTLLARNLGKILGCTEENKRFRLMNGPEIFDKFVGNSEKNIRRIFQPAKEAWKKYGINAPTHMVVIDEIDAMLPNRNGSDNNPVRDSVVNQFLGEMDGLDQFNNLIIIGLTNRLELLDPAVIRSGRFSVHIKFDLPDNKSRYKIFEIYTKKLEELKRLHDINLNKLVELTKDFSGADIEEICNIASSLSLERLDKMELDEITNQILEEHGKVTENDFLQAIKELTEIRKKNNKMIEHMYI